MLKVYQICRNRVVKNSNTHNFTTLKNNGSVTLSNSFFENFPRSDLDMSIKYLLLLNLTQINEKYPIYSLKDQIIDSVLNYDVTLFKGSPGCGKSTQVPIYLEEISNDEESRQLIIVPEALSKELNA